MKEKQLNLFNEPVETNQKLTDVLIIKNKHSKKKKLTKEQMKFNRLIKDIEFLSLELENKERLMEEILVRYPKEIQPIKQATSQVLYQFSSKLHHLLEKFKYTPAQQYDFGGLILNFIDTASEVITPDEEMKRIYDIYSEDGSFDELEAENYEENLEDLLDMIKEQLDIDIDKEDVPDMRNMSPEMIIEFAQKLKDRLHDSEEQTQDKEPQKETKKNKKQLEREAKEKAAEELKKKSLRSLYLSLAKVLHPDSGGTEEERHQKDELMKQVTIAYENKDLSTLLKLEIEWLTSESQSKVKADDQLKVYNEVLSEQVEELRDELNIRFMNPRYYEINSYCHASSEEIIKLFEDEKDELEDRLRGMKADVERVKNKKTSLEFLKEINNARRFQTTISPLDMLFADEDDFPF